MVSLKLSFLDHRKNLTDTSEEVERIETAVTDTNQDMNQANDTANELHDRVLAIKALAQELKDNATDVRDLNIEGAYNSIKESEKRSNMSQDTVNKAGIVPKTYLRF